MTELPMKEFFCHVTGEIHETRYSFVFCPACGEELKIDPSGERHGLYDLEN